MSQLVRIPWDRPHPYRYTITEREIDLDKMALVVMDAQQAYLSADLGLGRRLHGTEAHAYYFGRLRDTVIPNLQRLIEAFRQAGLPAVFTRLGTMLLDGSDLPPWSWRRAGLMHPDGTRTMYPVGSAEQAIIAELAPRENELVIDRATLNPFNSSPIERCLRNMGIEALVIAGVLTEAAPETMARSAGERGFAAMLIEDACATLSPAEQEATFQHLAWCVGKTTDEILGLVRMAAGGP